MRAAFLAAAIIATGNVAQALDCGSVALQAITASAFDQVAITGIDEATLTLSTTGAPEMQMPLVGATFAVPPHPVTPFAGGTFRVTLHDVDGSCDLGALAVSALARADGAVARRLDRTARLIGTLHNLVHPGQPVPQIETASAELMPLAIFYAVQAAMEQTLAEAGDDPLVDALFAAATAGTDARIPLQHAALNPAVFAPATRHAESIPAEKGFWRGLSLIAPAHAVEVELDTTGLMCPRDAASLSFMAKLQIDGEAASHPDVSIHLERANLLLGAGVLLAKAAKSKPLEIGYGMAAAHNTSVLMMANYTDNLFPSRGVRLDVITSRRLFMEDSDPTGTVTRIDLIAGNKGWKLDKLALDLVAMVAQMRFQVNTFKALAGWAGFAELSTKITARGAGLLSIPPQEFCPVDITGPQHHQILMLDGAAAPFVRSGDMGYRARATGTATLYVSSMPAAFGHVFAEARVPLTVEPIRVTVRPPGSFAAPGETVRLFATVTGAENKALDWSLDEGVAGLVRLDDAGSRIDVVTDTSQLAFPVRLRAVPVTRKGLRARTDAPDRSSTAIIETVRPRIAAAPLCIEPGETHRFEVIWPNEARAITFYADGGVGASLEARLRPVWSASAGRIGTSGLFTAPDLRGETVTITVADATAPALTAQRDIRVGGCTCFWSASVGGAAYEGYFTYVPALFDLRFDRDGDGMLDLRPMVDGKFGPKDEPSIGEIAVEALIVNYPRETAGPSIMLSFDPPFVPGGRMPRITGSISAETAPGAQSDLSRLFTSDDVPGEVLLSGDFMDFSFGGTFTRFEDGRPVETANLALQGRARAGYSATSACEGPDAPMPGRWITDVLPALPSLPVINR